jgi:hypothetical protein
MNDSHVPQGTCIRSPAAQQKISTSKIFIRKGFAIRDGNLHVFDMNLQTHSIRTFSI